MLKRLYIHNYVFIQNLTIDFDNGYQVITGETGAGKSIILDALSLALGERFDKSSVLGEAEKCIVEVEFDVNDNAIIARMLENFGFDILPSLIIRREWIPPTFRTRSFINDTPCTVEQIQQLANYLVDLHRQFDHLNLFRNYFEIETIDAMAGNQSTLSQYTTIFNQWKTLVKTKADLEQLISKGKEEQSYLQHVLQDVEQHQLLPGEMETLEKQLKKMQSAESLAKVLYQLYFHMEEKEESLVQQLAQLNKGLEPFSSLDTELQKLHERVASYIIELQDIAETALSLHQQSTAENMPLAETEQRLSLIYTLLKKYHHISVEDLLAYIERIKQNLQDYSKSEAALASINQEIHHAYQQLTALAQQLSVARQQHITLLDEKINQLLKKVGMVHARWQTTISHLTEVNAYGQDDIAFLVDINNIGSFSPVAKVASGGELSRIMLCLKTILANYMNLTAMIFDEIDVGISGETSRNIAQLLVELGLKKQVVCITHQPAVAAQATTHFYVYKTQAADKVATQVVKLNYQQRIETIAKMLDGDKPSSTSLQHAQEMIDTKHKN